jgi:hypothetical protein
MTDFVSLTKKGEKLRVRLKLRVDKKLSLVLKHDDRILCNGQVYNFKNLHNIIQNLETDDEIVGGLSLSPQFVVLGHSTYGQISIW